jgi:hypothetical protein
MATSTIAVRTGNGVSVMLGSGGGTFAAPIQVASSVLNFNRRHIAAGDLDDDGDIDLVCNDEIAHFMLLRSDGAGGFEEERHGRGTFLFALDLGRIDGDGLPDVVVVAATGEALSYLNLALSAQWADLGYGLAGTDGVPSLVGQGMLETGSAGTLKLAHAKPGALALLFISVQSIPTPFKGGVLATVPPLLSFTLFTSPSGTITSRGRAGPRVPRARRCTSSTASPTRPAPPAPRSATRCARRRPDRSASARPSGRGAPCPHRPGCVPRTALLSEAPAGPVESTIAYWKYQLAPAGPGGQCAHER